MQKLVSLVLFVDGALLVFAALRGYSGPVTLIMLLGAIAIVVGGISFLAADYEGF